jgi:hypothetical protein
VVAVQHELQVSQLVAELLPLGQRYLQDTASKDSALTQPARACQHSQLDHAAVMEQLLSYSVAIAAAVPSVDMARREWRWRNGFFLQQPGGRTPRHLEWLARASCSDLVDAASV